VENIQVSSSSKKQTSLQIIVLLLIGFIAGFATHVFVVSYEDVPSLLKDNPVNIVNIDSDSQDSEQVNNSADDTHNVVVIKDDINALTNLTTPNNMSEGGYIVSVSDQKAGRIVYASQVVFEKESWLVIREQVDGKIGNILGARRYPSGTHIGVVNLLRNTEPGRIYYAVIFIDDGDGEFDFKKDTKLVDDKGNVVTTIFKVY